MAESLGAPVEATGSLLAARQALMACEYKDLAMAAAFAKPLRPFILPVVEVV